MIRNWAYILVGITTLIMVTASVSAFGIYDKDKDGVIEVGEKITFVGDEYIVESDGDIHTFTEWAWDFDGDAEIDAYGQVVIYEFTNDGLYRGYLYEMGDVGYSFTLEIEVYISGDYVSKSQNNGQASGWYRNGCPGNGNHNGIKDK